MLLKQRLDQRQVQKLILAPALQQAIKLLPLTNLELIEVIDSEVSQNPMLEEETQEKPSPERGEDEERTKAGRTEQEDVDSRTVRELEEASTWNSSPISGIFWRLCPNFWEKSGRTSFQEPVSGTT
jgi:DNA-directed RNA polymerase specialized sigma54-like protein